MGHWVMDFDWQTGLPVERDIDLRPLRSHRRTGGIRNAGRRLWLSVSRSTAACPRGFEARWRRFRHGWAPNHRGPPGRVQQRCVVDPQRVGDGGQRAVRQSMEPEITSDAAYLEVAFKATQHWQFAGRYDWQDNSFGAGFDYGPEFDELERPQRPRFRRQLLVQPQPRDQDGVP